MKKILDACFRRTTEKDISSGEYKKKKAKVFSDWEFSGRKNIVTSKGFM
jgi:hypothetical protein